MNVDCHLTFANLVVSAGRKAAEEKEEGFAVGRSRVTMGLCAAKVTEEELKSMEVERQMEEDMMMEMEKIKLLLLGE